MIAISLSSFRDELLKIAASVDAETRNNMAMRHEVPDFLLEGRLAANDSSEVGYIPKVAKLSLPKTRDEFHKEYNKVRKPAAHMARGALVGGLIANVLSGGRAKQGYLAYSTPAALGAGAGLADYALQGKSRKKKLEKVSMMGPSSTFTPGRALTTARNTGSFQDKVVHKGSVSRPPVVEGFSLPQKQG